MLCVEYLVQGTKELFVLQSSPPLLMKDQDLNLYHGAGSSCSWNTGWNVRRLKTAAKMSAVAAVQNRATRRSPCGDSEQCEDLKQNGERWEGRKWQLQILEQRFLEGQSLVELALTSNSGLKLDQVIVKQINSILNKNENSRQEVHLLPLINPRLNLLLLRRSLLLRCQKTKTEPLLTISLESAHRIVR